jgi:quercetin dioxygenase-like cupin family protein
VDGRPNKVYHRETEIGFLMKINRENELKEEEVREEGAQGVARTVLIGPGDGSEKIIMRYFKVQPGGKTPLHQHPWEHIVRVEKGEGVVYSENEGKFKVGPGQSLFIRPDEEHQFLNPYGEPFEFVCVIPNPGE